MQLATKFLGIALDNPLVLASGILGTTGASLANVAKNGAGAVTSKSIWRNRHAGHANPTVLELGGGNLINAVGLPHGGIAEARIEFANFRRLSKKPLFASIAAHNFAEFGETAAAVAELAPDVIELNISCPNVESEFGRPFACEVKSAEKAVRIVKKKIGEIPLAVKLSPNVADIAEIARAVEAAGADAITAVNTVGPGMVIDVETATPILANRVGGLSGPAIRPIAVKAIFEIFAAVRIPIIGTGGVSTGRDAIEFLEAGATLVGVGSAAKNGPEIFGEIKKEIAQFCRRKKNKKCHRTCRTRPPKMTKTLPQIFEIKKVIDEADGIRTLVFLGDFEFSPGQFVMVWLPKIDEKPYGIWRLSPGEFRITVSAVGDFSKKLAAKKVGDSVGIRGPRGRGFSVPKKKKVVLVGGGFGVAPLLGLAERAEKCELDFVIGARSRNFLFGEKYAAKLGARVAVATDDGSCGAKCFSTDLLEKIIAKKKVDAVFSCGPEMMMKKVAEICRAAKIPSELSLERFMKCGVGVCGSCAIDDGGFCVCREGPMIEGERALRMPEFGKIPPRLSRRASPTFD